MRVATDKQINYVNILLSNGLGGDDYRKLYLNHFFNIGSSKELNFDDASKIIEKYNSSNVDYKKNLKTTKRLLDEKRGQSTIF